MLTENACWVASIAAACLKCHLHVQSLQSALPLPEHQAFYCSVCHFAKHPLSHDAASLLAPGKHTRHACVLYYQIGIAWFRC